MNEQRMLDGVISFLCHQSIGHVQANHAFLPHDDQSSGWESSFVNEKS